MKRQNISTKKPDWVTKEQWEGSQSQMVGKSKKGNGVFKTFQEIFNRGNIKARSDAGRTKVEGNRKKIIE